MKAEQRKELETNTLANKMGQAMKRVSTSPRRSFLVYVIIAAVLVVVLYLGYRWWVLDRQANSERWVRLYDGSYSNVLTLINKDAATPAGKAARFQAAWILYWNEGLKMLGNNSVQALNRLNEVAGLYNELAKDCKDDPIFEPQALLGLAVVEETKAIQDVSHLDKAAFYYEDVVTKYKESAQGKFAQDRLDQLKDKTRRADMANLYMDLQKMLNVRPPQQQFNFQEPNLEKKNPPPEKK